MLPLLSLPSVLPPLGSKVAHVRRFDCFCSAERQTLPAVSTEDARKPGSPGLHRSWRTFQIRQAAIESSTTTRIFSELEARLPSGKSMEGLADHGVCRLLLMLHRQRSRFLELWVSKLRQRKPLWASLQGWALLWRDLRVRAYLGIWNSD